MHAEPGRERPTEVHPTRWQELLQLEHLVGNRAMAGWVQRKLEVGSADDPAEREADAIAERVIHHLVDRRPHDEVTPDPARPSKIHRSGDVGAAGGELGGAAEERIRDARIGGEPLGAGIRSQMESAFGADFGDVRLHRDRAAADASRHISASAFTHGSDIFYGDKAPSPETAAGRELLAHELTHTLQQGATRAKGTGKIRRRFLQPGDRPNAWKDETKKKGKFGLIAFTKRRSKELKEIDAAVAEFHRAERSDDRTQKLVAVENLLKAIAEWRGSKKSAGAGSMRGAEIDELQHEASGIWLQLDETPVIPPPEPAPPTEPGARPETNQPTPAPISTTEPSPETTATPPRPDKSTRIPMAQNPAATKNKPKATPPRPDKSTRLPMAQNPAATKNKPKATPPRPDKSTRLPMAQNPAATKNKPRPETKAPASVGITEPNQADVQQTPPVPTSQPRAQRPAPAPTTAAVELPTVEGWEGDEESLAKTLKRIDENPFLRELLARVTQGANEREIGWKLAWRVEVDGEKLGGNDVEDVAWARFGDEDYGDAEENWLQAKRSMTREVRAAVTKREALMRSDMDAQQADRYIQACAEIVWLGYAFGEASYMFGIQESGGARALVSHGLHKEHEKEKNEEFAVEITEYKEAMAMLREAPLRRVGKPADEIVPYYPLYKRLIKPEGLAKEDAILIIAESAKAGAPRRGSASTAQAFAYMTKKLGASSVDAARWIATLSKAGVTPDSYLSAVVHGNPKQRGRVESALQHKQATRPTEQGPEKTKFDPEKDLAEENIEYALSGTVGGGMNRLDLLEYGFGLDQTETGLEKVTGGRFAGYFKKDVAQDLQHGLHRGSKAGIPEHDPGFNRRALAMYELDKWFGQGLIPPTFRTRHEGKTGALMQEIVGKSKREADQLLLQRPSVRRGLSSLYLLDYIAGQSDRHSANVMITKAGGVFGIDNDLAFGKEYEHFRGRDTRYGGIGGALVGELSEIDHDFAQKIIANAKDTTALTIIREALAGLVSDSEIEAMIKRLTRLAEALEQLEENCEALHTITDFDKTTWKTSKAKAKFVKEWK